MLVVATTARSRWLSALAHGGVGVVLLVLSLLFAVVGGWFAASILGTLGMATMVGPAIARAPRQTQTPTDLFVLAMSAAGGLIGLLMLLRPDLFAGPGYHWMRPYPFVHGMVFLACSLFLLVTHLTVRAAAWSRQSSAVLFAAVVLVPMLVRGAAGQWNSSTTYGVTSVALITGYWLGPLLEQIDPRSLRTRLAVALGISTALALIVVVTVDTNREEASLRSKSMAAQQSLATALSHDVADYVELHEAAARSLAAGPGIMERSAAADGLVAGVQPCLPERRDLLHL